MDPVIFAGFPVGDELFVPEEGRNNDAIVFFGNDRLVIDDNGQFAFDDIHDFVIIDDSIRHEVIAARPEDMLRFADVWIQFVKVFHICHSLFPDFIIAEEGGLCK